MKRTARYAPAAGLLCLLASAPIQAQQAVHGDVQRTDPEPAVETAAQEEAPRTTVEEQIVVSANRIETPAAAVGSSVTVITAEEIAARKKISLYALLRTVPGLEVNRTGPPGGLTSVFIRGGSSSHTLVLVDGVRLNSTTAGQYDFAELQADDIERIEIVRGPQSTLYGSEAMAGVISITTRRGQPGFRGTVLGEAGDDDLRRGRLHLDGGTERFDFSLSLSDEQSDGISVASEAAGNREADAHDNTTVAGRLGFDFLADGRVDLTLRRFESDAEVDGFDFVLGPVDDPNATLAREGLSVSLGASKRFGGRLTQRLHLGFSDDDSVGADPDSPFNRYAFDSSLLSASSQSDLTLPAGHTLTFGAAYEEREGGSEGAFDERLDILSGFLQDHWAFRERLFLTAGLRYDDHGQFGGELTYRLTGSLRLPGDTTRLHGSYGTGFKAPTLNDLFFPFLNNPDLEPETSTAFDLGVEQRFADDTLLLDLTYFDIDFEDLIALDATFTPQNIAAASSRGVELVLRYRPGPRFTLGFSHTYNETEEEGTGLALARRPEHRSVVDVFFRPLARLSGSLSFLVVRDRFEANGSALDDYERLDLSLSYRFLSWLEPYLRVENLFDEDYEELPGYTTPGARAAVGLEVRF